MGKVEEEVWRQAHELLSLVGIVVGSRGGAKNLAERASVLVLVSVIEC